MGLSLPLGGQPYIGNFHTAVAKASKNPEATYWLIKYFGAFDIQREIHEGGLSAVRSDVLDDPKYKDPQWWEVCGRRGAANSAGFKAQLPYVGEYLHFNSVAMGKIYEMQIVELHEAAIGKVTPEEMVKRITRQTIKLQKKFGELPIREEK
jgi:ABC-type glycerol-3-phosphate transport system substrate-binding protein